MYLHVAKDMVVLVILLPPPQNHSAAGLALDAHNSVQAWQHMAAVILRSKLLCACSDVVVCCSAGCRSAKAISVQL